MTCFKFVFLVLEMQIDTGLQASFGPVNVATDALHVGPVAVGIGFAEL